MTDLIAFEIYRTEEISIFGKQMIARFLRRKDHEAYELLLSDEASGDIWKCGYSAETARDFAKQTGEALEQHVYAIIRNDAANDIKHT